ncbi:MAG: ATP-binding protein [Taibaiella sp.]|jgi:two-component system OmpR family sensor kinase
MKIKSPLFWKIFLGFFITFNTILVSVWLVLIFHEPILGMRPPPKFPIPLDLVILGILGGLIFSGVLAWYMVQPIQRLRSGFAQLAQGKLNVRLQKIMGNRHDELADLARDFDYMAAQMENYVNSRNQLLHDVSHELRSPLARLNIATALLEQDPTRLPEIIKRIKTETQHLDNMTDELLTLFRAESGSPSLDNYIDLNSLIYTIIQDAEFEAKTSGINIQTNIHAINESASVGNLFVGNAQLLHRAIENIVRNALSHAGNDKRIEVNLSSTNAQYTITVRDHGHGVPEEKLHHIFESFVRLQSSNPSKGFGLGLAIARRAIFIHQGHIKAENHPEGGLLVTITLPCK